MSAIWLCHSLNCYISVEFMIVNIVFPLKDTPEIISISDNQTLNKGDSVSLNCTADGYPTPSITWRKVSDNSLVSFPLTITGKENEGLYRCSANNSIGSAATQEVNIIVHRECWNVDVIDSYTVVLIIINI